MDDWQESVVEHLSIDDCWDILTRVDLGRLALAVGDDVDIFPMNFLVHERGLVLRTAPGSKLFALSVNPHVAFEVEEFDDTFAASVVVKGVAERVERQSEIDAASDLPLTPWIPTPKYRWVRITPASITGRRFSRVRATDPAG